MQGYSRANSPPFHISRQTLQILTGHYPERLGVAYIVNAPWIFGTLWSLVSPFLDPVTKAKIRFVNVPKPAVSQANAEGGDLTSDAASIRTTGTNATTATNATKNTVAKMAAKAADANALLEIIDPDMLEYNYGGLREFKYVHEDYWKAVGEFEKMKK
jgi:hypothetical protein